MAQLLEGGLGEQFFGLDTNFAKDELQSKLHSSETIKKFLVSFTQFS
jgi:hypothetical protein